jgi:SAM-dependent methyltransferase
MSWFDRTEFRNAVLTPLNIQGRGLEVAPYFNPVTDKATMNVAYTDYISTDEIRRKASENPGGIDKAVPEVDFVWTPGKPLRQCIPVDETFDYAIASHVMEHVPNPVGWLNDILAVMKPGAVIAVILPDKRVNMDYFRRETTAAEMLGWWAEQPSVPTPGQIFDFLGSTYQTTEGAHPSYREGIRADELARCYTDDKALDFMLWSHAGAEYLDIHCTVWTPEHFALMMRHMSSIGVMNVEVSDPLIQPVDFAVHLTKLGEPRIAAPSAHLPSKEPTWAEVSSSIGIKGSAELLRRALTRRLAPQLNATQ